MTKPLMNLTLAIVKEEVALLAAYCPNSIYQDVLDNPDALQKLMAYVLSRIPNTYAFTADAMYARGQTTAHRLQIETLLKQGVDDLVNHHAIQADRREMQQV